MRLWVDRLWTQGLAEPRTGPWRIDVADQTLTTVARDEPEPGDIVVPGTALPGFIDMHEHIGIDVGDEHAQALQPAGEMLLRGAANLRTMLDWGVTTIRDCGERADVERFWVEAVEAGTLPGPRVIRSVSPIARTGGHAWYLSRQTDGVGALRARVREHVRDGANFIKMMVSGGVGTVGSDQSRAEYTRDEVEAVVAEATRLGVRVAAHGHGGAGVDDAIAAGVRTIEHGLLLTPAQLDAMAAKGVTLVLTAGVMHEFASDPRVPASIREFMPRFVARAAELTVNARAAGVSVVVGTDAVHGEVGREVCLMVDGGYSVAESLGAATHAAAAVLERPDLGVLEPGARADLLIVDGDPFVDTECLRRRPTAVMRDGRWHTAPGTTKPDAAHLAVDRRARGVGIVTPALH